jgi:hypothetical protein
VDRLNPAAMAGSAISPWRAVIVSVSVPSGMTHTRAGVDAVCLGERLHLADVRQAAAHELEAGFAAVVQGVQGARADALVGGVAGVGELGRHVEAGRPAGGVLQRLLGAVGLHLDLRPGEDERAEQGTPSVLVLVEQGLPARDDDHAGVALQGAGDDLGHRGAGEGLVQVEPVAVPARGLVAPCARQVAAAQADEGAAAAAGGALSLHGDAEDLVHDERLGGVDVQGGAHAVASAGVGMVQVAPLTWVSVTWTREM